MLLFLLLICNKGNTIILKICSQLLKKTINLYHCGRLSGKDTENWEECQWSHCCIWVSFPILSLSEILEVTLHGAIHLLPLRCMQSRVVLIKICCDLRTGTYIYHVAVQYQFCRHVWKFSIFKIQSNTITCINIFHYKLSPMMLWILQDPFFWLGLFCGQFLVN